VASFDLAQPDLDLTATTGSSVVGLETLPAMVANIPPTLGKPLLAINGDYFEYLTEPRFRGTLQSICLNSGELLAGPSQGTVFWVDEQKRPHLDNLQDHWTITFPDGAKKPFALNCSTADFTSEVKARELVLYTPSFGPSTGTLEDGTLEYILEPQDGSGWLPLRPNAEIRATVRTVRAAGNTPFSRRDLVLAVARTAADQYSRLAVGDPLVISTAVTPDLSRARLAVGGDPPLLLQGNITANLSTEDRAPRSVIGFNGTRCCFVVVDGRQPDLSVGMTHREMAELMQRLGCTDALNMDGGGSSALWYRGTTVNSPSDGKPRPVGEAIVLVRKKR